MASALIGTVIGSLAVGRPADRWGRRTTLVWMAVFYFVSAVGSGLAWDWASFLFFRFLGGLAVGGASVVCPMYIAEISPAAIRGRLVAVQQFNIVLGILLAYLSNYVVAQLDLGDDDVAVDVRRRGVSGRGVLLPAVYRAAEPALARRTAAASTKPATCSPTWAPTPAASTRRSAPSRRRSTWSTTAWPSRCFSRAYREPILLAVAIAMFNQLSGINALMYYAPHIFKMAGAADGIRPAAVRDRRRDESGVHDGGDGGHRPLRPADADARRLDRLHRQPSRDGVGILHLRHGVHADRQQGRAGQPAGVHRVARLRPGGGDLGVHQRNLSQPRPRPRAGAGQLHALDHGTP